MKKLIVIAFFILFGVSSANAQKFAYVDTQYILDNIPEYQMAKNQLESLTKKWQKEIEGKMAEIDKMYRQFQTDAVLLPADIKKQREEEIHLTVDTQSATKPHQGKEESKQDNHKTPAEENINNIPTS